MKSKPGRIKSILQATLSVAILSALLPSLLFNFLRKEVSAEIPVPELYDSTGSSIVIHQTIAPNPIQSGELAVFSLQVTNTDSIALPATVTNSLSAQISTGDNLHWTTIISPGSSWTTQWSGQPLIDSGRIENQVQVAVPTSFAENLSYCTTCAEEDNINIPLVGADVTRFRIVATHPTYSFVTDSCAADFSGCSLSQPQVPQVVTCDTLYDDGINVFSVCSDTNWWLPDPMTVTVGGTSLTGHRLVWNSKVSGENSWPEVLVLYQDGNLRLKPHPPLGVSDICFGSSIIVGPATIDPTRPYTEIQNISIDPSNPSLAILYRDGGSAQLSLAVNREKAEVMVRANYDTSQTFATFRSMYVTEDNADTARVSTAVGDYALLDVSSTTWSPAWSTLAGPHWFFYRQTTSSHNTSAPDILVEALDGYKTYISNLSVCVEQCAIYLPDVVLAE